MISEERTFWTNAGTNLRHLLLQVRYPLLIFLVTRLGLFLIAYLSLAVLPLNSDPAVVGTDYSLWRGFPENIMLDGWARWDSAWYKNIAEQGYAVAASGPAGQTNIAFFPLYPLLVRGLNLILHNSQLSGIVISNLALLVAILLLHQMVQERFGTEVASRATWLLSVFPFSFFFSAFYSEALFFLLVVASFFFAERSRWGFASAMAMLAGCTRIAGLALFPALVLLYLEETGFDLRKIRPNVAWIVLSLLGPAIYALLLYFQFGDPLLYVRANQAPTWWGQGLGLKLDMVGEVIEQLRSTRNLLTGTFHMAFALNLLAGGLFYLSLIPVFRRQGLSYGILSLLLVLSGTFQPSSLGRYVIVVFPVFTAWALLLKDRRLFEGALVLSTLVLALLTIMFSHWYWVA